MAFRMILWAEGWGTHPIPDAEAAAWFKAIVTAMTDFAVDNLSDKERNALAEGLRDPSLTFESDVAADLIPEIVEALLK